MQREFIQALLDDQQNKITEELSKLKGKEYLNVIAALLEYAMPKLNRTEISADSETIKTITGMVIR